MQADFCIGCGVDFPPCIVSPEFSGFSLDQIISGKLTKTENRVFVCPVEAQTLVDEKLKISNACIDCCICANRCPYTVSACCLPIREPERVVGSLPTLRLYLETQFSEYEFYDQVSVRGNYRTKRIDIVGINRSKILLFKSLKNTNKLAYYLRSYKMIIENEVGILSGKTVNSIFILPSELVNEAISRIGNSKSFFAASLDMIKEVL